jgi:hypothetical protein
MYCSRISPCPQDEVLFIARKDIITKDEGDWRGQDVVLLMPAEVLIVAP